MGTFRVRGTDAETHLHDERDGGDGDGDGDGDGYTDGEGDRYSDSDGGTMFTCRRLSGNSFLRIFRPCSMISSALRMALFHNNTRDGDGDGDGDSGDVLSYNGKVTALDLTVKSTLFMETVKVLPE